MREYKGKRDALVTSSVFLFPSPFFSFLIHHCAIGMWGGI